MAVFWQALLDGRLTGAAALRAQFATLYPMFGLPAYYGLGVMAYRLPDRVVLGHSGGGGLRTVVVYDPSRDALVAVSVSGDRGAEATANLLLAQVPVVRSSGGGAGVPGPVQP